MTDLDPSIRLLELADEQGVLERLNEELYGHGAKVDVELDFDSLPRPQLRMLVYATLDAYVHAIEKEDLYAAAMHRKMFERLLDQDEEIRQELAERATSKPSVQFLDLNDL